MKSFRERECRWLFCLMFMAQVLWWFLWQYVGRTDEAFELSVSTVVLAVALLIVPTRVLRAPESESINLRKGVLLAVSLVVIVHPFLFFSQARAFGDAQGLFQAAQFLREQGLSSFFDHYTRLPWVGKLHPPLNTLFTSLWLPLFGSKPPLGALPFALLGLGALLSTYRLGARQRGVRNGLLALLCLLGMRYFWVYLTTPGWGGLAVLFVVLAQYGAFLLSKEINVGAVWLVGALTAALYTNYLTILVIPSLIAWIALGARPKTTISCVIVSLMLFTPWVMFVKNDGSQIKPLARHLPVRPLFDGEKIIYDQESGQVRINYWHLKPNQLAHRAVKTLATLTSQGIAILVLCVALVWKFRRDVCELPLLLWVAAGVLAVLLIPISRYALQALPAIALIMGRGLSRMPFDWSMRMALFCVGVAILAAYQHPGAPY